MQNQVLTVIRAVSVVLVLVAIVAHAVELANHGLLDPTRFLAYFTIQRNRVSGPSEGPRDDRQPIDRRGLRVLALDLVGVEVDIAGTMSRVVWPRIFWRLNRSPPLSR